MPDTADAVVFLAEQHSEWTYMCAHCDANKGYPARDEMFVWKQAIRHLGVDHGLKRVWIESHNETVAKAAQVALPLIWEHYQQTREPTRSYTDNHA